MTSPLYFNKENAEQAEKKKKQQKNLFLDPLERQGHRANHCQNMEIQKGGYRGTQLAGAETHAETSARVGKPELILTDESLKAQCE